MEASELIEKQKSEIRDLWAAIEWVKNHLNSNNPAAISDVQTLRNVISYLEYRYKP